MTDELAEEYLEAAPHIRRAVAEHGEDRVIENYFPKIAQLGVVMHDVISDEERRQADTALREYWDALLTGTKPNDE